MASYAEWLKQQLLVYHDSQSQDFRQGLGVGSSAPHSENLLGQELAATFSWQMTGLEGPRSLPFHPPLPVSWISYKASDSSVSRAGEQSCGSPKAQTWTLHVSSATFYCSEQITGSAQIQGEENRLYLSKEGKAVSLIHHADIPGLESCICHALVV